MKPRFAVRLPLEIAYTRNVLLAVELLDAVTLERVTQDVEVQAKGLTAKPVVNSSGMFVWRKDADAANFDGLVIEPTTPVFERREITKADVTFPHHVVELHPLATYPFNAGDMAIRGRLVESNALPPPAPRVPIVGATVRLEWQDDDGGWHPWQAPRVTDASGDFTAMVRLSRGKLNEDIVPATLSVNLWARRANGVEKHRIYPVPQGRAIDRTFGWDELQ
jgi:hypothetical protein